MSGGSGSGGGGGGGGASRVMFAGLFQFGQGVDDEGRDRQSSKSSALPSLLQT